MGLSAFNRARAIAAAQAEVERLAAEAAASESTDEQSESEQSDQSERTAEAAEPESKLDQLTAGLEQLAAAPAPVKPKPTKAKA